MLERRQRLTVDEALPVIDQMLSGLSAAHRQGMVHRDIKPANILLDHETQRALLADFGLVKSLDTSSSGKTATGIVMGTADYISPEQGRGQAVDARSDLYSVGVLLFRMLSGCLPFTGDSPTALIFQHVYEMPPDLASISPDVPAPLATIVGRLLAKSPADRYQNVESLLKDLRAVHPRPAIAASASSQDARPSSNGEIPKTMKEATWVVPAPASGRWAQNCGPGREPFPAARPRGFAASAEHTTTSRRCGGCTRPARGLERPADGSRRGPGGTAKASLGRAA